MRLGYSIPNDWSFAIAGGDWLGTDAGDPAFLQDRSPAARTFFTWPAGAQTTATTCAITGTRTTAFVPYLAALLNTSLPLGTLVTLIGKRPADAGYTYELGGNCLTSRVVDLPDGGRGIIWLPDAGLDPINAFQATAYNDVNSVAAIPAESVQSVGELIVMPAAEITHEAGPTESWPDRRVSRTLGAQASVSGMSAYRVLTVRSALLTYAEVRGDALGGVDWQQIAGALARDPFVLAVLYPEDAAAHRSAIFGTVSGLGVAGQPGRYQRTDRLSITEVPSV
jgi:hypothetical protein